MRFGAPVMAPDRAREPLGRPSTWAWIAPRARIGVVFEWLEEFADCAVGGPDGLDDAINASCGCAFWPCDLGSGRLLPGQHGNRIAPAYWSSGISVRLQTATVIALNLMLPFEEPTKDARRYLLELRSHLPVVLDPQHLYHCVPRADLTKYDRRPLAAHWLDE